MSNLSDGSPPACSVIIPTRNRATVLHDTLTRLAALPDAAFEVVVVDNASTDGTHKLRQVWPQVRWIPLTDNLGAAARNVGAMAAAGRVLLMLDDDSWPAPGVISQLVRRFDAQTRLGAVACRVRLADPPHRHDAGGVAGVFFNCGGAVRRTAFLAAGGYPTDYDYYVEEYALCCELWRRGWTVERGGCEVVWHRRTGVNRNVNQMLRYLVRNNVRLWNRYAPQAICHEVIAADLERYRRVAKREDAVAGFEAGLREAERAAGGGASIDRRLSRTQFDHMMGLHTMRQLLRRAAEEKSIRTVAVWTRGKGCEFIIDFAKSIGLVITCVYDSPIADGSEPRYWRGLLLQNAERATTIDADAILPGTLSLGVAEDLERMLQQTCRHIPVINPAPWNRPDTLSLSAVRMLRPQVA